MLALPPRRTRQWRSQECRPSARTMQRRRRPTGHPSTVGLLRVPRRRCELRAAAVAVEQVQRGQ
eukprot:11209511-Lingulodinium_polyedra.AAC.1